MADETPKQNPAPASTFAPRSDSPFGQRAGAGQGGQQRRKRQQKASEYKKSLVEKQTLKQWYGLSERQFKKYVKGALAKMGKVDDVSAELIRNLERRLDNVVFRMGLAKTRAQARQLVTHGYFQVNGKRVNIPSYSVLKDDVVALKETKKKKGIVKTNEEMAKKNVAHAWLAVDSAKMQATAVGEPTLDEVKPPAQISLIFEFYSR
jgi:small subunit ribosomal protein S4